MIRILCKRPGQTQSELINSEALAAALTEPGNLIWMDLCLSTEGVHRASEFLTKQFAFHPLAIEDALLESHLARVDDWQKYLYMAFHAIEYTNGKIAQHELDLFLGPNYLITIHFDPIEPLEKLWQQVEKSTDARQTQSPDRLLYHLLDKITTTSMHVVECFDDALDDLEQEIFSKPRREHLPKLFQIRRTVLQLRRIFGSQREAVNRLARDSFGVVLPESKVYFRDIYDHLVRMHELSDGLRDMASGALESHLSVTSYRMNEVMRTLTVVTVLFMPLTFLTGYFGMNFFGDKFNIENPFSPWWLFGICMVIMLLTPPVMFYWMKRRGWLNSELHATDQPAPSES